MAGDVQTLRDDPSPTDLEESMGEQPSMKLAGKRAGSPGRVLLVLAAGLLLISQFLPRNTDALEPFFVSWPSYVPDFDHIFTCASRNTHIKNLLTQIGFLSYWGLVLLMPGLVFLLKRSAPLLWAARIMAFGVAGYLLWEKVKDGDIGAGVLLICLAVVITIWMVIKLGKLSKGARWALVVVGAMQIGVMIAMNLVDAEWMTTSFVLILVALLEGAGLMLTQRVKRVPWASEAAG
jgi:hypothetical protein